jgi:hypothetical protein
MTSFKHLVVNSPPPLHTIFGSDEHFVFLILPPSPSPRPSLPLPPPPSPSLPPSECQICKLGGYLWLIAWGRRVAKDNIFLHSIVFDHFLPGTLCVV